MTNDQKSNAVSMILHAIGKIIAAAVVVAAVAMLLPTIAHAGSVGGTGGATEITQIQNNIELALQSVEEQFQTLEIIEQKYLARLENLKSSVDKYTAPFQKAYSTYQKIQATQQKLVALGDKLKNLDTALMDRYRGAAAAKLNWKDYMAREKNLVKDGNERAIAQAKSNHETLVSTKESMEAYQKAAGAMEESTGSHQATRVLGAQLTLLGGDINKLITITAQTNTNAALDRQDQVAKEDLKNQHYEEFMNAVKAERDARRKALGMAPWVEVKK